MSRVILVGCVKQKATRPLVAEELYRSPLFRKRRAYAEATGDLWFILSASYGLVPPNRVIRPYDLTLNALAADDRRRWGELVAHQLLQNVGFGGFHGITFEVHAGSAYVGPLSDPLTARGGVLDLPMAGLGIGQQLAWYGRGE